MKGVIFNLLEGFISDGWGEETYEEILSLCPLKTKEPFVGPGTYPDSDLVAIATQAANKLGISLPEALRAFGGYAFPKLIEKYPVFMEGISHPKDFLKSVDGVIHVEVRKLFPEAVTPSFEYEEPAPDRLKMRYRSKRKMCPLIDGFLDGVEKHFGMSIEREHTTCMHQGADFCDYELRFAAAAVAAK